MTLRPEHWPRIEDKLRLFVQHVERGREPPEWLMEFMAEGAREFMRGGKPWQKPPGRKTACPNWPDATAHVLCHDGGLFVEEVVQALGVTAPRIAEGTEVENLPGGGNGGGQQILHSRVNLEVHPSGFQWSEGSVVDDSPSIAELGAAGNWPRVVERKAVGLAFLVARIEEST